MILAKSPAVMLRLSRIERARKTTRNWPPRSAMGKKPKIRGVLYSSDNQKTWRLILILPSKKTPHISAANKGADPMETRDANEPDKQRVT